MGVAEAKRAIIGWLEEKGLGKGAVNFRLRDWLLSRQRYWGVPIPVIHCEKCGEVAVPEDQLPVELPELRGADLKPKGVSPLAAADGLGQRRVPDRAAARRSATATRWTRSSTRRGTSCATARPTTTPRPSTSTWSAQWMPCDIYIGGVEHAVLHLLYARFFTKVLHDMGMLDFVEPFSAQLNQGIVINQGKKMSKSLGNGVSLGDQLDAFGVDAVRLTLVFAGPPEDDIDWADMCPAGSLRFLQRAWRLSGDVTSAPGADATTGDVALRKVTHRTVHDAQDLVEGHRFNVMVARMMELVNATRKAIDSGAGPDDPAVREATEAVAMLLSLVAPYTAEEMWERLGHRAVGRPGRLAGRRRGAAGRGVGDRRRTDPGQGQGPPGGAAGHLGGRPGGAGAGRPGRAEAIDGREVRKVIVREPKLVNVVV